MKMLNDIIDSHLSILFIGFNPSLRSAERGHHFAGRSNRFWRILHRAGLTPMRLDAEQDMQLLSFGYGITNIVDRPTKAAADITKEEYAQGRIHLRGKLGRFSPRIACYVGKGVYQQFSKRRHAHWGLQKLSIADGILDFVAPSSSGLVRMPIEEITDIYRDLTRLKRQLCS